VQEAVSLIDAAEVRPRVADVPLGDALGLHLAEDVVADRDYPPFDKSMMDGYAVRTADVAPPLPALLRVVGSVAAGQLPHGGIGPGEAMTIMTGAPLPDGADGVVPMEDVEGGQLARPGASVKVLAAPEPRRY